MNNVLKLKKELNRLANSRQAQILQRFFKTGKGEYGEGDIFLGIKLPEQRKIAKKYNNLFLKELQKLLLSKIHEHRLVALLVLVNQFNKTDNQGKKQIFNFYLQNIRRVNNWDLVDLSAANIVGQYLLPRTNADPSSYRGADKRGKNILYQLAKSKNLWERRIAIITTQAFIRQNNFEHTLKLTQILLKDKHDLIHKACGWMLREVGKRNRELLEKFLNKHSSCMPRTMLRYAIERLPEKKKKYYLSKPSNFVRDTKPYQKNSFLNNESRTIEQNHSQKVLGKKGFTLIEILIAISIMGLITGIIVVALGSSRTKARDTKRKSDVAQIGRFVSLGCYMPNAGAGEYDLKDIISELRGKYPPYANTLPDNIKDPSAGTDTQSYYRYIVLSNGDECVLYANLENADEAVTLPHLSAPTPKGGTGVLEATSVGWNKTNKYFQVSN